MAMPAALRKKIAKSGEEPGKAAPKKGKPGLGAWLKLRAKKGK